MRNKKIIAFDFDGTVCEDEFPKIGKPKLDVIRKLKDYQDSGKASLILWTCRNGEHLDEALIWLADNFDLIPDAVNENIPSLGFKTSNKIFANVYLDDRALNIADF